MGRTCFAGSGVTGAGCKRVVMDYPGPWSSVRFESVCVLLMSFFRGTSIWPLRLPGWRPKKSYSLACRRLGEQRRTNISFARSGSGALVSAGFSTLASLVCPARSFFFALPPSSRPSLIPFQPTAPQDTKKATPFEAACCQGCRGNHRRGVAAGNLGCAECLVIQVGFGHGRFGGVVAGKPPSPCGKGHDSAEELPKDLRDLGSEEEEA